MNTKYDSLTDISHNMLPPVSPGFMVICFYLSMLRDDFTVTFFHCILEFAFFPAIFLLVLFFLLFYFYFFSLRHSAIYSLLHTSSLFTPTLNLVFSFLFLIFLSISYVLLSFLCFPPHFSLLSTHKL